MTIKLVSDHGIPVTQAKDLENKGTLNLKSDVVIVGSGAGGAVMAYEMAKAGKKVIVLEAGPYVPSTQFNERFPDMLETLYQDGGNQANKDGDLVVLQGRCVGGSTVVNGTVAFRTPEVILEKWNKQHGLTDLTRENLDPYFQKIEEHLSVHENQEQEIAGHSRILRSGAEKLGISWKPLKRNVKQCGLTGHCLSGCATDRKQSMLVTYLPWAISYGAQLFADTRVTNILSDGGVAKGVEAEVVDPETGELVAEIRVDAQVVVVAAGAVQTPLLFLESGLANSSGQVGKNFACHPSTLIFGEFEQDIHSWRGALLGAYVDEYEDPSKGGFILEGGGAGPVEIGMSVEPGTGKPYVEFMLNAKKLSPLVTLIHDENVGEIRLEEGKKVIDYAVSDKDFPTMKEAFRTAAKVFFAAGAKRVFVPTVSRTVIEKEADIDQVIDGLENGPHTLRLVSYHPQGTMRMGVDKRRSVVGPKGECHDVKNLYVADASLFPTSVVVNPQMTVYALSNYIADQLLKSWV